MSDTLSKLCDKNVYIKMNERVESLNAAVATSIILYEINNGIN
jgi:tRNA G18 (ribose-2'-O)-methylase SpoU